MHRPPAVFRKVHHYACFSSCGCTATHAITTHHALDTSQRIEDVARVHYHQGDIIIRVGVLRGYQLLHDNASILFHGSTAAATMMTTTAANHAAPRHGKSRASRRRHCPFRAARSALRTSTSPRWSAQSKRHFRVLRPGIGDLFRGTVRGESHTPCRPGNSGIACAEA